MSEQTILELELRSVVQQPAHDRNDIPVSPTAMRARRLHDPSRARIMRWVHPGPRSLLQFARDNLAAAAAESLTSVEYRQTLARATEALLLLRETAHHRMTEQPRYIARATDFIDAHFDRDLCAQEIANAACVSTRSLNAGFRRHLDATPTQYLRTRRLQHVRNNLL